MSRIKKIIILIMIICINIFTCVYASDDLNSISENVIESNDENNVIENEIENIIESDNTANEDNLNETLNIVDNYTINDEEKNKQENNNQVDIKKENNKNQIKKEKKIKSKSITFKYEHTGFLKSKKYIRKKNDNNSKKIIQVNKGKNVKILDKVGRFYKVQYKQKGKKYIGFILKKHIELNSNIKIIQGNSKKLKVIMNPTNSTDKISYSSSNSKCVAVDKKGNIIAKKKGVAIITAKTESKKEDYIVIEVKKKENVKMLEVEKKVYLKVGESYSIKHEIQPANTTDKIMWISENSNIVSVNKKGKINAKKAGMTKVYLKTSSGKEVYTKVYVAPKGIMKLNKIAGAVAASYKNVKRIKYGKSVLGENLEAYEIRGVGKNSKVIFIESAVHGFEDEYPKDGKVLVNLSNKLIEYYANNPKMLKDYTMIIVPCANPDGTLYGKNNFRVEKKDAFGRCTYKHIDINRDFANDKFKSKESRALVNLMKKYSKKMIIQLDLHGWEDSVLGDKTIVKQFRKYVGNKVDKTDRFGGDKGFIIGYTKSNFNVHSALVEFKNSKSVNEKNVEKALNSIMKIIKK